MPHPRSGCFCRGPQRGLLPLLLRRRYSRALAVDRQKRVEPLTQGMLSAAPLGWGVGWAHSVIRLLTLPGGELREGCCAPLTARLLYGSPTRCAESEPKAKGTKIQVKKWALYFSRLKQWFPNQSKIYKYLGAYF
ncbi:hypothetical protein NDU88_001010 [Pleurodeles waltl]|uniref:Uncharacterized protein n=1 Tax=Pleurodeles waltl TaxID=8319 RepID=A0AAV7NC97_PLEWA|nr:hypothetical protein NDU88_001010 [Pleurodeles waltl]